jgi:osmoprotectant transport system permease protein
VSLSVLADAESWIWWDWVGDHTSDISAALREHLVLTLWAVGLGLLISFPLAVLISRWRWLEPPVLSVTGVLYTIPSLALFAALVPWTGLSRTTAIIPLVSYTLLILLRNIGAGLASVPADIRDAATGMGYSPVARFLRIELPLAVPAIVAGVRVATVTTIGLVTVTAVIGLGGLGSLILDGLQRDFKTPLVVGSVLSVLLAVGCDIALAGVQRLATPWSRRKS